MSEIIVMLSYLLINFTEDNSLCIIFQVESANQYSKCVFSFDFIILGVWTKM